MLCGCGGGCRRNVRLCGREYDAFPPSDMNPTQESIYDKVCKDANDECAALQSKVDIMINDARAKMSFIRSIEVI